MATSKTERDLLWIELRDPILQWENQEVQRLFSDLMTVKILGYRPYYAVGVVPVDTTDFFATHYIVARRKNNGLEVVSGFREVTLSRCEKHFAPFPLLSLLRSAGSPRHLNYAERLVNEAKTLKTDLAYHSCFTVNPGLRHEKELVQLSMNHMHYQMHFSMKRSNHRMPVSIAVVDRFNGKIRYDQHGFNRCNDEEGVIPPFLSPFLGGESVTLMETHRLNSELVDEAEARVDFWNSRVVMDIAQISERIAA